MTYSFKITFKQYRQLATEFDYFIGNGLEFAEVHNQTYLVILKWDKLESCNYELNQSHDKVNKLKWTLLSKYELKAI